jgi:hypothetical protein
LSLRILLLLAVLALLSAWIAFTDGGRILRYRAARIVGLQHPAIELDYGAIDAALTERDVLAQFPDLDWRCMKDKRIGDRACDIEVSSINGIPATSVIYFFERGRLKLVRAAYEAKQFPRLEASLDGMYPRARNMPTVVGPELSTVGPGMRQLAGWKAGGELLVTDEVPTRFGEIVLIWQDKR